VSRPLTFAFRLPLLACSALVALRLVQGTEAVLMTGAAIAFATLRLAPIRTLVAISLLGLPFLGAAASLIGLTATTLVMGLDLVLLLMVLITSRELLSRRQFKGLRYFLIWWSVFMVAYSASAFSGQKSEYSTFAWEYFAVYGSYYALAGVLAARSEIELTEVLSVGLPLYAFQYWQLHSSLLSLSQLADPAIGLRGNQDFDPINGARTAGLLLLMALCVSVLKRPRLRWLPEVGMAVAIGAPLTWYSYTRQVYIAVILVGATMLLSMMFASRSRSQTVWSKLVPLATLCVAGLVTGFEVVHLLQTDAHSRVVQLGLTLDRTIIWKDCIELIASHPLLGVGISRFQELGIALWPHNWIIEAWLAMGLVGPALTLSGGVIALLALRRGGEPWLEGWSLLALYYLIVAQVSADIARNSSLFFFLALAFHSTWCRRAAPELPRAPAFAALAGSSFSTTGRPG